MYDKNVLQECRTLSGFTSFEICILIMNNFYYFINYLKKNRVTIYIPKRKDFRSLPDNFHYL